MKKITVFDICLLCFFIILIIFAFYTFIKRSSENSQLYIKTAEDEYYYSLDQKKNIEIKGSVENTVIEIDNGRFRFYSSPCPNKDCVKMGWVSIPNYPVICLPNKVSDARRRVLR